MTDAMNRVKAYLYHNILSQHDQDVASLVQELEETRKQLERAEELITEISSRKLYPGVAEQMRDDAREYFAARARKA